MTTIREELTTAIKTAIYAEIPVIAALFIAIVVNAGAIGEWVANMTGAN